MTASNAELEAIIKTLEGDVSKLEKIILERKDNEKYNRQQAKANIHLLNKEKLKIEKKFKELEERCDLQVKEIFALRKVVSVYPEMRDKYCQTFF